jgi:ATP:ADP antiporter, AAA family
MKTEKEENSEQEHDRGAEAMPLLELCTAAADISDSAIFTTHGKVSSTGAASAERKRVVYETRKESIAAATREPGFTGSVLDGLWGPAFQSHAEHMPRVAFLSSMLCCIIGSFWLLDSLKDTVFATIVGLEHQPLAKMLSVLTTLVLVLYYNNLLDRIATPKLFYLIGTSYTLFFALIAFLLSNDFIGMANTVSHPSRIVGWMSYFAIESYGSLAVALFWAFSNATVGMELAECSYGLILAFAQLGAVVGSTIAVKAETFGVPCIYAVGALLCSSVVIMVKVFVYLFPEHLPKPPSKAAARRATTQPCSSMCTGLYLVLRYEYMLLIFGISCLYEVVLTVLDYEMKIIGRARFDSESPEAAGQFAALMGHFGQVRVRTTRGILPPELSFSRICRFS